MKAVKTIAPFDKFDYKGKELSNKWTKVEWTPTLANYERLGRIQSKEVEVVEDKTTKKLRKA